MVYVNLNIEWLFTRNLTVCQSYHLSLSQCAGDDGHVHMRNFFDIDSVH